MTLQELAAEASGYFEDEEDALDDARAEAQERFPLDVAARLEWIRQREHDADNAEDRIVWTRLAEEVRGQ